MKQIQQESAMQISDVTVGAVEVLDVVAQTKVVESLIGILWFLVKNMVFDWKIVFWFKRMNFWLKNIVFDWKSINFMAKNNTFDWKYDLWAENINFDWKI